MPFRLHLPDTKARSLPKKQKRPATEDLRAAAARLDDINNLAPALKVPAFAKPLSDSDGDDENHSRTKVSEEGHGDIIIPRRCRESCVSEILATIKSESTASSKERIRRRLVLTDSKEELETPPTAPEDTQTNSHLLKQASGTDDTEDTLTSKIKSSTRHRSKKTKAAYQKLLAELGDFDIDMRDWDLQGTLNRKRRRSCTYQ